MGAKGQPKTGGRKKGSPNKVQSPVKKAISDWIEGYSDSGKMKKDLDSLDPKDRLAIMEKLSQYVMPKIQAVSLDVDSGTSKITIEQKLIELSKE